MFTKTSGNDSGGETRPLLASSEGVAEKNEERTHTLPSVMEDAVDIVKLGIPIFISRISFVGMKITDTALLGHVSGTVLAASALSDLWTMWSLVLLDGRVLGVLVGGAVGAGNPKLAGIYLQISYLVVGCMSVFVIVCWNVTEPVLRVYLEYQDDNDAEDDGDELAHMAGYYSRVLSLAIPAICGFSQLAYFFAAQRILHPEVNASALGLLANLAFGLFFVLGWPPIPGLSSSFHGFGFVACPIVTAVISYLRLAIVIVVYIGFQKLHAPCWDGWYLSEFTWERIQTYCGLYVPSAASVASDFWRVTVIGAIAAKLGPTEVAIFNTSYRIMWIGLILVSALSTASSINLTIRLGRLDPNGARQTGYLGIFLSASILVVLSAGIFLRSDWFARIFTNDAVFLQMFEEARLPFAITLFLMNLQVAIQKIPYSMGRTDEIFWTGFVAGWGVQVPAAILCTRYWRYDLIGLYSGMGLGFLVQVILFIRIVLRSDWKEYAEIAQDRSEAPAKLVVK